tara:strand:+ start:217 stop:465 length:249 start_codon:yes stop_codon:yes gene_type:complete
MHYFVDASKTIGNKCLHDDNNKGENIMRPIDKMIKRLETELKNLIADENVDKNALRLKVERLNKAYLLLDKCNVYTANKATK